MSRVVVPRGAVGLWRTRPAPLGPRLPYVMLLPAIVLIGLVDLYPFLSGLALSFQQGSLVSSAGWVGLENYQRLAARPEFWSALVFSALFTLGTVLGCLVLGLGLALALHAVRHWSSALGVMFMLPFVLPSVVATTSWRWLIGDESSLVNVIIGAVGLGPIYFLATPEWGVVSVTALKIWRIYPFMMLTLLAARQGVSKELYEAATMDGAGHWQAFRFITMPQIRSIAAVASLLLAIWTFNDFETPWLLTQGGPSDATTNLAVLAYRFTFSLQDVGLGSAVSVVSLALLMVVATIVLRGLRATDR